MKTNQWSLRCYFDCDLVLTNLAYDTILVKAILYIFLVEQL